MGARRRSPGLTPDGTAPGTYAARFRNALGCLPVKSDVDKRVQPHGFRHTSAVELEQADTPVTVISKLLGHSSLAVTSRYLDLTNHKAVPAPWRTRSCPSWPADIVIGDQLIIVAFNANWPAASPVLAARVTGQAVQVSTKSNLIRPHWDDVADISPAPRP